MMLDWWWAVWLGLAVVFFAAAAYAAEVGRVGAEGEWHYHDSAWEGIWIPTRCCGNRECYKANADADPDGLIGLRVQRVPDGSGYVVTWPQTNGKAPTVEFLAYDASRIEPSQDGQYWVCHVLSGGDGTRSTRCLFPPALGF